MRHAEVVNKSSNIVFWTIKFANFLYDFDRFCFHCHGGCLQMEDKFLYLFIILLVIVIYMYIFVP